jgi:hypothetical protein
MFNFRVHCELERPHISPLMGTYMYIEETSDGITDRLLLWVVLKGICGLETNQNYGVQSYYQLHVSSSTCVAQLAEDAIRKDS